ncbi:hypothetical protein MKX78_10835 [Cytobacillus sp. FSL R5-0569]|uniref:hypothetical protein n=1 Tax=Cytobacillus sp. FSL R5-0569 TaxID=2921649 RepID=UPI0030F627BA
MKKAFVTILTTSFILFACGGNEETTKEEKPKKEVNVEIQKTNDDNTQEKLSAQLKEEATKADFVELNVDNPPNGKKVFIDGEVSSLIKDDFVSEFILTSKENDGYGMYKIKLLDSTDQDFNEGDQVRIYGGVSGKDDTGTPEILASILEKK